ncbi:MAG: 4-hydroxy-tetrahydrodipicolinate reductase ['Candidatus Kapabacteria' thiocyanatum]|uniref:4-hydroxy-tetrahydrodipicolinate reductase n=1 Tax=Candidatus Kapaibacterium thiocyanatum TaxID=1895771 RepID=A0A1M3L5T4_9BACT|nr:4-hydroxy-tetrahydrodipicolinate reductase ['Candidatus Kapabacteria' thiocyanatum]OJX60869.1 MAG: 4-hydroxy-tetrahydrodipicolinate reductase ['Candidatus Kapabacteria' thiocyanatum]
MPTPTRIALVGHGAMGREIERLAPQTPCAITRIYDEARPFDAATVNDDIDVVIDFTQPDAVLATVETAARHGIDVVIGTTGWMQHMDRVKGICDRHGVGLIHGSNFSVGVQLFFRLVRAASILVQDVTEYDVMIHEWHHRRKKDSPSGTALTMAGIVLDELDRKTRIVTDAINDTPIAADMLHVSSTRGGEIVGRHVLTLDSAADRIELTHDARNRSGFALGALLAAEWIHGKTGVYDFTDVFPEIMSQR